MNYAEYGLDTDKKSKDDDSKPSRWLCLWCGGHPNKGFTMCFSNFVICFQCLHEAKYNYVESLARWEDNVDCFKCNNKKPVRGYRTSPLFPTALHICESCIEWGTGLVDGSITPEEFKENTTQILKSNIMSEVISPKQQALKTLQQCTVQGNIVKLPPEQLDRTLYNEVKKLLELIGGKWTGGKTQGFVFQDCDEAMVKDLLQQQANGDGRNLKKEYQFFPTPSDLATRMAQLCTNNGYLSPKAKILEPSAGDGALVTAIVDFYPTVTRIDCFEIMEVNRTKLAKISEANLLGPDFLRTAQQGNADGIHGYYDVIIANPPFSNNQDIDHIRAMYRCLKNNGRLVTVASMSWVNGSQKKQVEFREWLTAIDAFQEELSAGTFKESGTNVPAMLLVIDKLETAEIKDTAAREEPIVIPQPIPGVEKFVEARQKEKADIGLKRITADRSRLIEVLKKAKEIVSDKVALPILTNILVQVRGTQMQITASDLLVTIVAKIEVDNDGDSEYDYLLPFDFFFDILKALSEPKVTIEVRNSSKKVKSETITFQEAIITTIAEDKFRSVCSEDITLWPALPEFHDDNSIGLADDMIHWLNIAIDTTSNDNNRPALKKVLVEVSHKGMIIASTTGADIFEKCFDTESKRTRELLIDKKIAKALKGMAETSLSWSDTHIAFVSDVYTIIGTIQAEKFPNYRSVFPIRPHNITLPLSDFIAAVGKLSLTKKYATINLKKQKNAIVIESSDDDNDRNVSVVINAAYTGTCKEIMFQPATMAVLLGQIKFQTINLSIEESYQPIIITSDSDDTYRALTMPVAISK